MVNTTLRTSHLVTEAYTDVITSIPGAADVSGFIRHLGGADIEIVMGGAAQPAPSVRGIPLSQGEEEPCEADHIWVKCRSGLSAVIGFDTSTGDASGGLTDAQLRASPVPVAKGQQAVADCVISNGQSLSAGVDLGVARLVGLSIPATFEPATLSFQASFDGLTWNNIHDSSGTEKTVAVGASRRVILSPADFYGVRHIKVRGGTAAAPTAVAADRTIKLITEA
jgi:hypothetical protein